MKTPILGQSYVARSVNAACDRMVNLYPEMIPSGGKDPGYLQRAPGLRLAVTVGSGPIRGMHQFGDYGYVVSGNRLYRLNSNLGVANLGVVSGSGPVSMADNGTQLFIAANPRGYIYNVTTNIFTEITDPDFEGANSVCFIDGYFVFSQPDTQTIWITSLYDGTSIDPLDFASAEGSPDGVVGVLADHRELWVFGTNSTEVWYNAGDVDFPFQRIAGAYNEIGCLSPYSIAKIDNGVMWLGQDARGRGIVYRADGYIGRRVSTHAVEWQIQQYNDLNLAVCYTYQQDGHTFYVMNFPQSDITWVYDAATEAWHERASLNDNGLFGRHRGNCQMVFSKRVLIGDYVNGNVYSFDMNTYDDNGAPQKWLRSWRALATGQNNLKRQAHFQMQLDCETGVGLNTGQGSDPQVMLRWSDDGGHTWSNEHWTSMGGIGLYGTRAIWRRLGMTQKLRDRVYEVSGTDPVKIAIMGAELHGVQESA